MGCIPIAESFEIYNKVSKIFIINSMLARDIKTGLKQVAVQVLPPSEKSIQNQQVATISL